MSTSSKWRHHGKGRSRRMDSLLTLTCRYEQLTIRANSLREELHTEITRMLNDVIKFKMHVQKSMEDYEGFVTDELEKELASEGMPEEKGDDE